MNDKATDKAAQDSAAQPDSLTRLLKLAGGPRDNALLHHAIGLEWQKLGNTSAAAAAFEQATGRDPNFSAAWKLLGKTRDALGDSIAARTAWERGIAVAEARGDVQAAKEMKVFIKRLNRQAGDPEAALD